jgi:hypothetical protein
MLPVAPVTHDGIVMRYVDHFSQGLLLERFAAEADVPTHHPLSQIFACIDL